MSKDVLRVQTEVGLSSLNDIPSSYKLAHTFALDYVNESEERNHGTYRTEYHKATVTLLGIVFQEDFMAAKFVVDIED